MRQNEIAGTWTQTHIEQKLLFRRSDQLLELVRRKISKALSVPGIEITFPNKTAGISLAVR